MQTPNSGSFETNSTPSYGERHNAWNHPSPSSSVEEGAKKQNPSGQPLTLADSIMASTQSKQSSKIVLRKKNSNT